MIKFLTYAMIYLGSTLMVINIFSYDRFARRILKKDHLKRENLDIYIPIILLVGFLFGYLGVGIFGNPDILVSAILFGGSIFVFVIFLLLQRITRRVQEDERLESRLLAAEENSKAKTAFLSSMSHEMRTPMNVIIGLDRLALKDPDVPDHTRDKLEKIGASARHLLDLINDVLDMNRIEAGRMVLKEEPFSLSSLFTQIDVMFHSQCDDKGLTYVSGISGEPGDAYIGDAMKLKRVLINILGNAVKFTNAPGTITFTAEETERTDSTGTLRFVIKDTGIGMDQEFLPKLFDVFTQEDATTTNRYGGSGLGMSISKSILEMMNGTIHVESEKGVGSTFTVTVPLKTADPSLLRNQCPFAEDSDHPNKKSMKGRRILLAEDMELNAEIMINLLGSEGIIVDHAENGKIAVEMFEKSSEFMYDAILMDVRMPVMDGLAATRAIRDLNRSDALMVPIIAMTANAFEEDIQISLEAGMNAHLSKPVEPEILCKTMHELITDRP